MDSASSEAGGTQATPNGSEADTEGAGVPVKLAGDALEELLGQMEEYAPTVSINPLKTTLEYTQAGVYGKCMFYSKIKWSSTGYIKGPLSYKYIMTSVDVYESIHHKPITC